MLQDASARADDAPSPTTSSVVPQPRGGRKFHHIRSQAMTTSDRVAAELVKTYGKLVQKIVGEQKFQVRRQALMDREDMVSIGYTMMIQAAETYDAARGAKLSTWIAFRVRQGLMKVVHELHVNGTRSARGEQYAWARGEQHEPRLWLSLDETVTNQKSRHGDNASDMKRIDTLRCEQPLADEKLEEVTERVWLQDAIGRCVSGRERQIVLEFLDGQSGDDIARRHEVSHQRVYQIYDAAIEKLRKCRTMDDIRRRRAAQRMSG